MWPLVRDRYRVGAHLEGGFAWIGAGLPLSAGLSQRVWVFAVPSAVSVPPYQEVRLPLGVSFDPTDSVQPSSA